MISNLLVLLLGLAGAAWLGWISVQSLRQIEVGAPPTEDQESRSRTETETPDLFGFFSSEGSYAVEYSWLPVVPEATAIGRIEQRPGGRAIVADPQLGLLLSPNPPEVAARLEFTKGIAGLLGAGAGILVLLFLLFPPGSR